MATAAPIPRIGISDLEGMRIGFWGCGTEIASLTQALMRMNIAAEFVGVAFDDPSGTESEAAVTALTPIIPVEQSVERFADCDIVIRSPRVDIYRDEIRGLIERGVPVTTPTGLWFAEPKAAPVIGITGSKGKSTTTSMLGHVLRRQGARVEVAGNIGIPVTDLVGGVTPDYYVIELSSYQIADLAAGPQILIFTALYGTHLEWHVTHANYFKDKLRGVSLPGVEDVVYNCEWPALEPLQELTDATAHPYAGERSRFRLQDDRLLRAGETIMRADDLPLAGRHNLVNACAVAQTLELLDRPVEHLAEQLGDFVGLPHRLAAIPTNDGITWIDDSFGSNPEATLAGLAAISSDPLILIASGTDRGQSFGHLIPELARREITVIALQASGMRMVAEAAAFGIPADRLHTVAELPAAVALAVKLARPGSTVLLSPAAGAFDELYPSCDARGRHFVRLVEAHAAVKQQPLTPSVDLPE